MLNSLSCSVYCSQSMVNCLHGWEDRALQECNLSAQTVRGLQNASGPVSTSRLNRATLNSPSPKGRFRSHSSKHFFRIWPINDFSDVPGYKGWSNSADLIARFSPGIIPQAMVQSEKLIVPHHSFAQHRSPLVQLARSFASVPPVAPRASAQTRHCVFPQRTAPGQLTNPPVLRK